MLIQEAQGTLFKLSRRAKFRKAARIGYLKTTLRLPKYHSYNERLMHDTGDHLPRISLLAQVQQAIDEEERLSQVWKPPDIEVESPAEDAALTIKKLKENSALLLREARVEMCSSLYAIIKEVIVFACPVFILLALSCACYHSRGNRLSRRRIVIVDLREREEVHDQHAV